MRLLDCDSSPIQPPPHLSRLSNVLNLLHTLVSCRRIHFMAKRKFQCSIASSFGRLGMDTNTPSSAYKSLHEYGILRVYNSPHLYELCTTLSVVATTHPTLHEEEEEKKKKKRRRSTSRSPSGDFARGSPASRRCPCCPSAVTARAALALPPPADFFLPTRERVRGDVAKRCCPRCPSTVVASGFFSPHVGESSRR
ncbi:hypothetical protein GW17_00038693, partial [Ensete ventricosum]